ncbi:YdcF family protein [Paenibacillus sediminis]|uniref:Uncharacterized SAM-binding protein YcdF (DUF218 family) n=1 Tax=Paenibacillus sediminis TaxID=664909 RepID=A0ABS4H096_9BACL|nr:YdcF family protein [Paenibacillus sediminis]MBP1935945.1 uncharacterized SAM-binding protein YcdF (DUF218 family) [Paenibacillus sediminis]
MTLRRIDLRKYHVFRRVLAAAILFIGASFLIIELLVISQFNANDQDISDVDYVVVLGARVKGTQLSLILKQRLDTALSYARINKDIPIIVSGGKGPGEDIAEATAMRDYLIRNGISKDRIILESQSTSTKENLLFSKRIIDEKGILKPRILIVTSDFHMFRAKMLAKKIGFIPYGISSQTPAYYKMIFMTREYFAMIKAIM